MCSKILNVGLSLRVKISINNFFSPWSLLHRIRYDGLYVVTEEETKHNKLEREFMLGFEWIRS